MSDAPEFLSAGLLEESSEEAILALIRRAASPSLSEVVDRETGLQLRVRSVVRAILVCAFPALAGSDELASLADEITPILLSHEETRQRIERLVGRLASEEHGAI